MTYAVDGRQHVAFVSGFIGLDNQAAPAIGGTNPTITVLAMKRREA